MLLEEIGKNVYMPHIGEFATSMEMPMSLKGKEKVNHIEIAFAMEKG